MTEDREEELEELEPIPEPEPEPPPFGSNYTSPSAAIGTLFMLSLVEPL